MRSFQRKRARTVSCAAAPSRTAKSGSRSIVNICAARSAGSSGSANSPLMPFEISSGEPPTRVQTIGLPWYAASSRVMLNPQSGRAERTARIRKGCRNIRMGHFTPEHDPMGDFESSCQQPCAPKAMARPQPERATCPALRCGSTQTPSGTHPRLSRGPAGDTQHEWSRNVRVSRTSMCWESSNAQ